MAARPDMATCRRSDAILHLPACGGDDGAQVSQEEILGPTTAAVGRAGHQQASAGVRVSLRRVSVRWYIGFLLPQRAADWCDRSRRLAEAMRWPLPTTSSSRRSARRRWCRRAGRAGASTRSPCARCSAGLTTASVSACSSRRSCAGRRCTSCPRPTRPSRAAAAVDCTTRWAAATRSAALTLPATTAASETRTASATSWR